MLVVLVRHGPAAAVDGTVVRTDAERPLSPEGRGRTAEAARGLATLLTQPLTIVTSPLRRAQETAAILAGALPLRGPLVTSEALALGGPYEEIVGEPAVRAAGGDVVLVGHEPSLEALASWLLTGQADLRLQIRKASALAIDHLGPPRRAGGTLAWFLPPRVLRHLGGAPSPASSKES